jgi:hypothetical protein
MYGEVLARPAWQSARVVYEQPLRAKFLITDRGWHYYWTGAETLALRAPWNKVH